MWYKINDVYHVYDGDKILEKFLKAMSFREHRTQWQKGIWNYRHQHCDFPLCDGFARKATARGKS